MIAVDMCNLYIAISRLLRYTMDNERVFPYGGVNMPVSKAQQRAVAKYNSENYDTIYLRVPKGKKAAVQDYAASVGESLNAFINRAIDMAIDADVAENGRKLRL